MGCVVVAHESVLPAAVTAVWVRVTDPRGINDELAPVLAMRIPRALRGMSIDEVPVGVRLGRAPLLLCGVLPVEFDHLTIASIEPDRRFHEKSTMMLLRRWEHERELVPLPSGGTRSTIVSPSSCALPCHASRQPAPWRTAWLKNCSLTAIAGFHPSGRGTVTGGGSHSSSFLSESCAPGT